MPQSWLTFIINLKKLNFTKKEKFEYNKVALSSLEIENNYLVVCKLNNYDTKNSVRNSTYKVMPYLKHVF